MNRIFHLRGTRIGGLLSAPSWKIRVEETHERYSKFARHILSDFAAFESAKLAALRMKSKLNYGLSR
ncbi:MAG: hypothetical protein LH481_10100 [Burkholderiales bacterium]|nr:hypothetical protein [Burkholderiales bacterium]